MLIAVFQSAKIHVRTHKQRLLITHGTCTSVCVGDVYTRAQAHIYNFVYDFMQAIDRILSVLGLGRARLRQQNLNDSISMFSNEIEQSHRYNVTNGNSSKR